MVEKFLENAKLLRQRFEIIPLLYGSLGLEYLMGEKLNADDIDILIPEIFLNSRWQEFKEALEGQGYQLIDEREHTFLKEDICYSYASLEELETFANIPLSEVETKVEKEVDFRLLSLNQYLRVYSASIKDGYRINVRKKKDAEKIALIKKTIPY